MKIAVAIAACALLIGAAPALAHHSFAVHFDPDRIIEIEGVVEEFRFRNPHGIVVLKVTGEDGEETTWRGETNAPVIMRRAGWDPDTLQPGDRITIEGWPGRDGLKLIRIRQVTRDTGEVLPRLGDAADQE